MDEATVAEAAWEELTICDGTAKRKADLLGETETSPNKIRAALKKFGQPLPISGAGSEVFINDFVDFLLESDPGHYGGFDGESLSLDVNRYINGEIWQIKLKARSIESPRFQIAMDMRKMLKDFGANVAQIAGRVVKNCGGHLTDETKRETRKLIQDSCDEVIEATIGDSLKDIKLLT